MRVPLNFALTALSAVTLFGQSQITSQSESVSIQEKLQIPGTELKPGSYTFAVEDRLQDRAVVRITNADDSKYTLVLTVSNGQLLRGGANSLILFDTSKSDKQVLRGWACPGCATPLEFVYPKVQAAAITGITTEPVIAVDPSYDKLPNNLSPDDMKVVTLWLLTPKPITATDKTKGVVAAKYVPQPMQSVQRAQAANTDQTSNQVASNQPPSSSAASPSTSSTTRPLTRTRTAEASTATPNVSEEPETSPGNVHRSHLPKTASDIPTMLITGLILLFLGISLAFLNIRSARQSVHDV